MTAVLAAAFLFNLGQGVLRPVMPLYLARAFGASYTMVTLIPVVFGAGKWIANLPAGYLLGRFGRALMICGLLTMASIDVASVAASRYDVFLGLRGLGGIGWAMFATVGTTALVSGPPARRRGRTVSVLLMTEASGLLLGSASGGWLYQRAGVASPFLFEAACMVVAAITIARWGDAAVASPAPPTSPDRRRRLGIVLRTPSVVLTSVTSAVLTAIQTGVLVFLFPLHLLERGGLEPEAVGLFVGLSVLGRLGSLWLGGSVADRWGGRRVLIPGLLAYAALLAGVAALTDPVALGISSLAIGAAAGLVAPIPTALTSQAVPLSLQGVAIGWLRTMTDTGQILGPLVMGALADAVDLSAPFLLGALLLAATAYEWRRHAPPVLPATASGGRDS